MKPGEPSEEQEAQEFCSFCNDAIAEYIFNFHSQNSQTIQKYGFCQECHGRLVHMIAVMQREDFIELINDFMSGGFHEETCPHCGGEIATMVDPPVEISPGDLTSGNPASNPTITTLEAELETCIRQEEYQKASELRDRIRKLKASQTSS